MRLRFRKSYRDRLLEAKQGNDHYADLAGKPRLPTHPDLLKPVRQRKLNGERISEADVNDTIREFSAQRDDIVLWRNNRGLAQGATGAPVRYGVGPNGSSDWIGYRRIVISPDMVGQILAQFIAVEAKAPDAGPPEDSQQRFIDHLNENGAVAFVARERKDLDKL